MQYIDILIWVFDLLAIGVFVRGCSIQSSRRVFGRDLCRQSEDLSKAFRT